MNVASHPAGDLAFAADSDRVRLSRLAKAGQALRLSAGVYAVGATLPPEAVARHHAFEIIGRIFPGAVLAGRTAFAGGMPVEGQLFVSHPEPSREAPLRLPGLEIVISVGPGPLPGDMSMPVGLHISGAARGLVENVHISGRPSLSRAGTEATEDRIEELARRGGAGRIRTVLGELDVIAGSFDPRAVEAVRVRLAAVLGTVSGQAVADRLRARLAGAPYDAHRIEMLELVVGGLVARPPVTLPLVGAEDRWAWLPFFEAYFSNFIEGTEFGVDEARRIAVDGEVPTDRPADAHDVAATFRLVSNPYDRAQVAANGDEFIDLLRARHAVLMAARPDKHPGEFKTLPNYAGGYQFVDPDLVAGTLKCGFELMGPVREPLARAVTMMVLVTECHPFDDGNGRVARLVTNAELSVANEMRLIIPTVYRNNYLVGLSGVSNGANGQSLAAILEFAQRWTAMIDWSSFEVARQMIEGCDGFVDPGIADKTGRRLTLPA